jgi:hypothetical protein
MKEYKAYDSAAFTAHISIISGFIVGLSLY